MRLFTVHTYTFFLFFGIFISVFASLSLVSGAHYITGFVNDSLDGTTSNGYVITLWNPANGLSDNVTSIIGPAGPSGADNIYFIDCEDLTSDCTLGDEIRVQVFNNGSDYVTSFANVAVSGAGFDVMPDLRLNAPPNVTLLSPTSFVNVSSASLSCRADDLDANLANLTLYGNWSNGWHANTTMGASGSTATLQVNATMPDGNYLWSCLAYDDLSIGRFASENYTFTLDSVAPAVSGVAFNVSGPVCGVDSFVQVVCNASDTFTGISEVVVQTNAPHGLFNTTASLTGIDTYEAIIALNMTGIWEFSCFASDFAENTGSNESTTIIDVHDVAPELSIVASDIIFSSVSPIENTEVTINATVHNNGCADATTLVSFYQGDPDDGGIQISANQTGTIDGISNATFAVVWNAIIGTHEMYIVIDGNNSYAESNETNNEAFTTLVVPAWQTFYGNITLDMFLGNANSSNLGLWVNESVFSGMMFIVDSEADVNWLSLQAIEKNVTDGDAPNDFTDIDTLLNMTGFNDSVSNVFGVHWDASFILYQELLNAIPVINSTITSNFLTGIVWDTSDDTNGEYDVTDQEDIVFITEINQSAQGEYGVYDYEVSIPVRLREYDSTDSSEVFIYFDLN